MAINLWPEPVIDAYVRACATGRDWKAECAAAQMALDGEPFRVLTLKALKAKGVPYSRQHLTKLVRWGRFPRPFQLPVDGVSNAGR